MTAYSTHPDDTATRFVTRFEASPEDWDATPEVIRRGIATLWEENERFRERLGQTSRNSSKPPSSDRPDTPAREQKPERTERKAGGQPGHADTNRPLVPKEQVTRFVPCRPACCGQCGHALVAMDCADAPQRHQVIELPPLVAEVEEYELFTATCPECGATTQAELPVGVPTGGYGPRVTALVTALTGLYHLSKRAVADLLGTCCQISISEASVQRLEQIMSGALKTPWQEAAEAVRAAAHVHLDETGWRQQRDADPPPAARASPSPDEAPLPPNTSTKPDGTLKKAWLWVAVCPLVILFLLRRSRGAQVVKEILGSDFRGRISSDRWSAYNWFDLLRRQLCWAHLVRDFLNISERGGIATRIGEALLEQATHMFALWDRVRDGTLAFAEFQRAMRPIQDTVGQVLRDGAATAGPRTATTCQWLVDHEAALWTFVRVAGIPPTNNLAEQAIRAAVIWRKLCFGTQTSAGSRYVERVLTVVATCKRQHRPVLDYLIDVANATYAGTTIPSILPSPAPAG